ncbi:MAG: hypothetical protein IAF08_16840 [Rhizobacter sp.]|nr:hypothetical protein [Chlorobiales bacterium]
MNTMKLLTSLVLVCAVSVVVSQPCAAQFKTLADVFAPDVDISKSASVKNLVVKRDAGTFFLQEGEIHLCRPHSGQVFGAMFIGKGTFSLTPPNDVERKQLQRFYNTETVKQEFTTLFVVFTDSTLSELSRSLVFKSGGKLAGIKDYLTEYLLYGLNPAFAKTLADRQQSDYFYACFSRDLGEPMFYEINAGASEEVMLMRRQRNDGNSHRREIVCQFERQNADAIRNQDEAMQAGFKIEHYRIEAGISESFAFAANAQVEFQVLRPAQTLIYFYLSSALSVDSVLSGNGERLAFLMNNNSGILWVECSPKFILNQTSMLRVYYHGDVLVKFTGSNYFYLLDPSGWYPRSPQWFNKATFDLTFHTPARLKFCSIGDNLSTQTTGDIVTSRWLAKSPLRNASFNIGFFEERKIESQTPPAITVLTTISGRRKDMEKEAGEDIQQSFMFFEKMFGKCAVEKLYATEIPYAHGEAFPGLIHLSAWTFIYASSDGSDELFRAHEVAHQWWGIGVGFKTYHDQWLSEGFAEYSGLWYVQTALKDNGKFFDMLRTWKDEILSNRQELFGKGQEAGPIWLGHRTNSSTTRGDYNLIIYKKGAWVLHMLRNLLIDLKTMKEDRFTDMMKEFYTTYAGSVASTADFQKIVEKHAGMPMDWFFKQWIYETAIPKYQFGYTVAAPNAEGKYQVNCRIAQLNVPADFQMYVPVKIDFGGGKLARLRVLVKGDTKEITLPLLPMKPERITFNDLESVLCEVENLN